VYSVAGERVVHHLQGQHKALVRGVAAGYMMAEEGTPEELLVPIVATGSYDKSVILWI
jgi:hypothetical protein